METGQLLAKRRRSSPAFPATKSTSLPFPASSRGASLRAFAKLGSMDSRTAGLLVTAIGLALVVIGLLVAAGALAWFGRLPGDIRWSSGSARVYMPITTMIVLSLALTLVSYLFRRFF